MALAETTLSSACGAADRQILVASATSISAGRLLVIDGEVFQVAKDYSSGTTVPVLRGQQGSAQVAHVSGARITHGDASDFGDNAPGVAVMLPPAGLGLERRSFSASGAITLPKPGNNMLAILNGTSVLTMTVAAPTKDMDGCELIIASNGVAAHTVQFTGGLSLAGGSYDIVTINASAPAALRAIAVNEAWLAPFAPAMGGTVTNLIGSIA